MGKPLLLDLFCKAGGAGMGYSRAGFEVIGVDIEPQPRYPFTFHQSDAVEFLQMLISNSLAWLKLSDISSIHASPPCQRYSMITVVHGSEVIESHPDLVDVIRKLLHQTGKPFVIENVVGAPLNGSLMLCGSMFNLEVKRHRIFEGHVPMFAPFACRHDYWAVPVYGHSGAGANRNREREREDVVTASKIGREQWALIG